MRQHYNLTAVKTVQSGLQHVLRLLCCLLYAPAKGFSMSCLARGR